MSEKTCYGCRHLYSEYMADGTIFYQCGLPGRHGIVIGELCAWSDSEIDDPKRCKRYTPAGEGEEE